MYTENCKTLMKEIEEVTNKCKDIPCFWIRRINIAKISILLKSICSFNGQRIQTPNYKMNNFCEPGIEHSDYS